MTAPTNSSTPPSDSDSEYVEMQGNSSPWTELFQADTAPSSRNASQRQAAATSSAGNKPQQRRSGSAATATTATTTAAERSDSDQRATQDALSAVFHQD